MRSVLSLSLAVVLAGVTATASASSFSDGFATGTPGLGVKAAGNFTAINGTNVDLLGPGPNTNYGYLCKAGVSQCVDLGGTGGSEVGKIQSNTLFGPGTYTVSFDLTDTKRGYDSRGVVTFGGYTGDFFFSRTGYEVNQTFSYTLTSASYLTFAYVLPNGTAGVDYQTNAGPILNSASVTSATPEPSSLLLLGSGLMSGVGVLARRRRKA